jgi:cell division protein FtsL
MQACKTTEFRTIKTIDNSRLRRAPALNGLRDVARALLLGVVLAAGTLVYAWQHFACIQLSYELESLKSELSDTARANQEFKLEVAGLRAPSRIDEIARNELGLTVPTAPQIAPSEAPGEPVFAELKRTTPGSSR